MSTPGDTDGDPDQGGHTVSPGRSETSSEEGEVRFGSIDPHSDEVRNQEGFQEAQELCKKLPYQYQ